MGRGVTFSELSFPGSCCPLRHICLSGNASSIENRFSISPPLRQRPLASLAHPRRGPAKHVDGRWESHAGSCVCVLSFDYLAEGRLTASSITSATRLVDVGESFPRGLSLAAFLREVRVAPSGLNGEWPQPLCRWISDFGFGGT